MKLLYTACLLISFTQAHSQTSDSVSTNKRHKPFTPQTSTDRLYSNQLGALPYQAEKQKSLVIKGNLTFTTYNIQLSPIENEISDLEAAECKAILKRDTAALKNLWARDFTLNEPQNEMVVDSKNPLPYYTSLGRMVENFSVTDNIAFTSGYEVLQKIKNNGEIEGQTKRKYFHTWTRKNGVWKLTTKTHE